MAATWSSSSKLQPHFISVWIHQAWRISYNVSVEFGTITASATVG